MKRGGLPRTARHPPFEDIDQLVSLAGDLVFHIEDLLALTAFLLLKIANLGLRLVSSLSMSVA